MKIHHVGYLVKRIGQAEEKFRLLGYSGTGEVIYDIYRDVDIKFLEKDGYCIELVSPKTKESVVSNLMKNHKNMPYHICYESDHFEEELAYLEANGFTRMGDSCPAPAIGPGRRVCFLMSARMGMIEVLEGGNVIHRE